MYKGVTKISNTFFYIFLISFFKDLIKAHKKLKYLQTILKITQY